MLGSILKADLKFRLDKNYERNKKSFEEYQGFNDERRKTDKMWFHSSTMEKEENRHKYVFIILLTLFF